MGAIAHYAVGEVPGTANLLYLAGAVGVGAGMIVDGRIVRGADGFAGEVGHMTVGPPDRLCGCGRHGLLGDRGRTGRPADMVAEPGDPSHDERDRSGRADSAQLRQRAAAGDDRVLDALAEQAHWLGIGVSILANVLNPDTIVLGGHFPGARYLEEP